MSIFSFTLSFNLLIGSPIVSISFLAGTSIYFNYIQLYTVETLDYNFDASVFFEFLNLFKPYLAWKKLGEGRVEARSDFKLL